MAYFTLKSILVCSTLLAPFVLGVPLEDSSTPKTEFVERNSSRRSPSPLHQYGGRGSAERSNGHNSMAGGKVTNAMRIARGLPPLAPRKLYNGSKVGSANRPRGSPIPSTSYGTILVYDKDGLSGGNFFGYVSKNFDGNGQYYVTESCEEAIVRPQLNTLSGALINPAQPGGYLNAGFDGHFEDFTSDEANGLPMCGTPDIPKESDVWSVQADGELVAEWINSDGTAFHPKFAYYQAAPETTGIFLANDLFIAEYINAPQIRLFLTDRLPCDV
ncbi:hypothetical protein FRB90_011400 [Tulasnella sp. 427]|nr:hypothetical protein FRB90_011400 [Tulasnella sp. 427]